MRVLAIDPGIASTGICLANLNGATLKPYRVGYFQTKGVPKKKRIGSKSSEDYSRIKQVMRYLGRIIRKHKPSLIAAEIPVGGAPNAAAAKYLAMATAVMVSIEVRFKVPLIQISPHDVKMRFTGNKKAKKPEIIEKAMRLHGNLKGWPKKPGGAYAAGKLEHPSDAVAILYACREPLIISAKKLI